MKKFFLTSLTQKSCYSWHGMITLFFFSSNCISVVGEEWFLHVQSVKLFGICHDERRSVYNTTINLLYFIRLFYFISCHSTEKSLAKNKSHAMSSIEKTDSFKKQCSMQIAWKSPGVQAGIAIACRDICNFSIY